MPSPLHLLPGALCAFCLASSLAHAQADPTASAPERVIQALPAAPIEDAVLPPTQAPVEARDEEPSHAPPATWPQPTPPLATPESHQENALPLKNGRVVILKSKRLMQVFDGEALWKSFRVALGPRPVGAKATQGDGRTPEGEFFICTRNAKTSDFHIFLGLSYPALPDAQKGVAKRKISAREFQIIRSRLASRQAPPWRTRLGGWIGIHGEGKGSYVAKVKAKRNSRDWTAGCIAVTNEEIEEISRALSLGARVSIRP
jgi:hypothetical protein